MKHFNYSVMIAAVLTMVFSLLPLHALAGSQWNSYGENGFIVDGLAYGKLDDGKSVCVTTLYEKDEYGDHPYPNLREANIPETVTYDGVTYTVTEIDRMAFSLEAGVLTLLEKVTIPSTVTKIGEMAFLHCTSLKSLSIGEGVLSIGDLAFGHCTELESVVLPDKLQSIADNVFFDCTNLKSVTIGKSVRYMGSSIFDFCTNLKDIYCHLMNPIATQYLDDDPGMVFHEVPLASCTLHIPIGTREEYEQCNLWNAFGTIVEDIEPDTDVDPWILLAGPRLWLEVGQVFQLNAWTTPADLPLAWTSSDESVATVDDQGVITAVAPGVTIITVAGRETGTPTATCEVTVKEAQKSGSDVNGDGVVDIVDVNQVINTMLSKGSR